MEFVNRLLSNSQEDRAQSSEAETSDLNYTTLRDKVRERFGDTEVSESDLQSYACQELDGQYKTAHRVCPEKLEAVGEFTEELSNEEWVEKKRENSETKYVFKED